MLKRLIDDCNKLIDEHNAGQRSEYPHWTDFILLPLAREIGTQLNMQYKVSGAYGLRYEAYITIFDDDATYTICITPKFKPVTQERSDSGAMNRIEWLMYDTGADTKPWDANGFGRATKRLPESIAEIIEILKEKQNEN